MDHVTPEIVSALNESQTVKDLLTVLNDNYDLNIIPGTFQKGIIISGLIQAMNMIKPVKKTTVRKRIISHSQ